ncbi:MAG: dihydrodipicolinate synthase family protein [Pigmentiphaga sp.]|uniref:dihydrodipicolinate synthase family protein n=1 Tax=Pigmentiphaga sp. TaxID=1977564 RepID=UPI0029AB1800|nr:dihydrodipicolinate synthase family protein [Pigmentiphaga sp.]MDX3906179.1 dihydrodipicolinate synthase family protein [Pigmentiphaga sp.]
MEIVNRDGRDIARRLYTALVLPLDDRLQVDEAGLRKLVRYYTDHAGFARHGGLIANPEAGEAFYLTREEKRRVLEIVLEEAHGRMPVLAGTFAWTTHETVELAAEAKAMGADGLFVVPPAGSMDVSIAWDSVRYPEVWLDQIKGQDRVADLPIFTHPVTNASQPWGIGLPLEPTLKFCREVPNIVGWKMTYAYPGHRILARAMREHAPHVALLCSSAHFFHEYQSVGNFDGTISGSWNYALEPMFEHIEAFRRNDFLTARRIWDDGMARLHEYIYSEPGRLHVRYKIAAWLRGLVSSPRMRPPMPAARPEEIARIRSLMQATGLPIVEARPAA